MNVRVHTRNADVTEGFRQAATDKLSHAARVFESQAGDIDVEVSEEHNPRLSAARYRLEVTAPAAGHVIRIIAAANTPEAALDEAVDRFNNQLKRLKGRIIDRGRKMKAPSNDGIPVAEEKEAEVVRIKQFVMKPMTIDEAALQMELLGHDFYFFLNGASARQSVLYRRRDGRLGLIEPA
jgi:putative sigma-54 modulation protein